ncbi:50S ribosomal protein L10 [Candidatus Woesearchaeota archaeon]|nr:50S ribosomal protein L10 [Candidatus Woesearchaeota archaeon]
MKPKARVAEYKKTVVQEFVKLMEQYPIIGAVNMEGLPTAQLQNMRAQLRDKVVLRMTKRRLMKIIFDKIKDKKPGIEALTEHLKGMPALLFTKENPFKLFKTLEKNKSSAPAKAGQIAPKDVVVKAGATPFAPGPVIGELGALGIKSGVEGGKIAIKEDKVVAKEGDVISSNLASILTRLGIQPMEIGLDLVAVYEDGTIYTKDVLRIDETEFMDKILNSHRYAFNLAFEIGYPTKDNIEVFIQKAFRDSKGLALEQNILADAVVAQLVEKAERAMLSLKSVANIPDVVKEEPKPEQKQEEPEVKEEKKEEKQEQTETVEEKPAEEVPKEEKKEEAKEEEKSQEKEESAKEPETVEEKKEEETTEEPKEEPKQEEKQEPEKPAEPEAVKPEEPAQAETPKEEPKPQETPEITEEKAEEKQDAPVTAEDLVRQTKEAFAKGELKKVPEEKKPSANDILDEIEAEEPPKPEKVPSAYELAQRKKR